MSFPRELPGFQRKTESRGCICVDKEVGSGRKTPPPFGAAAAPRSTWPISPSVSVICAPATTAARSLLGRRYRIAPSAATSCRRCQELVLRAALRSWRKGATMRLPRSWMRRSRPLASMVLAETAVLAAGSSRALISQLDCPLQVTFDGLRPSVTSPVYLRLIAASPRTDAAGHEAKSNRSNCWSATLSWNQWLLRSVTGILVRCRSKS